MGGAGLDGGDPQRAAVGGGEELDVATEALVRAGVPQVVAFGSGPGEPIGADQGAVENQVAHALLPATEGDLGQLRGALGQHVDALVQVPVGGGLRHSGITGQAVHTAPVAKPAQHQHGLAERPQHARTLRGADPAAVRGQQPSQALHHRAGNIEGGSIGNQREASGIVDGILW